MSYVLEALQKREADADPDAAVSLALAGIQRRRHRTWMLLFAGAMTINLAIIAWLFRDALPDSGPPVAQAIPMADVSAAAAPESTPATGTTPAAEPPQTAVSATASAADPAGVAAPPATPSVPAAPRRVALRDLPESARARLPGLAFSTHVYADDADLRAVVANGRRLAEGDRIQGVVIDEITETGVVLGFERYLIEVPVFTDWDTL
jgi:hypothetical protein